MVLEEKKSQVSEFSICSIHEIENSEIWEIFLLLQSLTVVVTQELKLAKEMNLKKS